MRTIHKWMIGWLFLSAMCSSVWSDGKVFARARAVPVETPDQRALIHYSNGVERLVIETSFIGEGTNFAWVVPLPSAPTIEAVSTNFLRDLGNAFQPNLVYKDPRGWITYLVFGSIVGSGLWIYSKNRSIGILACFLFMLLLAAAPKFVKARGIGPAGHAIDILDRRTVGIFDTVTLGSPDGRVLLDWLNTHGFHTPTSALPVISSYATQGWVFAAATIHRDSEPRARSQPHPLSFTFSTARAVYPLRLTGVENNRCMIELFVFGAERAEVPGLAVEHCGLVLEADEVRGEDVFEQPKRFFAPPDPGEYRFFETEICRFVSAGAITTKLIGTWDSLDMRKDAWIHWVPFKKTVPTMYTPEAAVGVSRDRFVGITIIGALMLQLVSSRLESRTKSRVLGGILVLAAVCGLAHLGTARITQVEIVRGGGMYGAMNNLRILLGALDQLELERHQQRRPLPGSFEEFRAALGDYLKGGRTENTFTGEPLRNSPTPGNLTLQPITNGMEVFWHDIRGAPHSLMALTNSFR